MSDRVSDVLQAVAHLEDAMPHLWEACTDPQATDLAELLADLRDARERLYALERDTEVTLAKAMTTDEVDTPTLRVERRRGTDRKSWDHAGWQVDARRQVLRKHGLAGAQGVLTPDGEVIPAEVLAEALAELQSVHGSTAPRTTQLKGLGLDPRDYCESSPGAWRVSVRRQVDESKEGAA